MNSASAVPLTNVRGSSNDILIKNTPQNAKTTQTKNNSVNTDVLKYVAIGLTMVTLVIATVIILRSRYRSQIDSLTSDLTAYQSSDALLKTKLHEAEHARAAYANRIKQLTMELSEAQNYNPSLPMNANSYDAPDPETPRQKPQVLKDREAIKSFVNSKRPTVQDEIDDRARNAEEQTTTDDNRVRFELSKTTHTSDKHVPHSSESSDDEQTTQHDDKVENIMNIIQSA